MYCAGIILLLVAVLPAALSQPQSYSQTDGITITTSGNTLYCDTLNCPPNAFKCVVTKKSINNHREVQRVRKCLDANGKVVAQSKAIERNPSPGMQVNTYAEGNRNGGVSMSSVNQNANAPSPEEYRRIMEQNQQMTSQINQQVQNSMNQMNQQMQNSMQQMQNSMQQTFGRNGW